jgi:hypothetical protein
MKATATPCVLAVVFFCISWNSGCSPLSPAIPQDKPPATPPERHESHKRQYFIHKVAGPGENFTRISKWYTGSGENWVSLVEANPLIHPRRIKIGDAILIPENLLIRRDPMPINPPPVAKQKEKLSEPSAAAISPIRESELFGPIDIDTPNDSLDENSVPLPLETLE